MPRTIYRYIYLRHRWVHAALVLAIILNVIFFTSLWGGKTLLDSAWNAPSVMPGGAYDPEAVPKHFSPTPDPGAPAWQTEPWLKVISNEYLIEHRPPIWNPYSAYGTPLAAAMQPQPYYPLTALLSLHPTAWTYDLFVVGRLFVAGLLTFLFARLFLEQAAALFAAITFMLTGYFILYLDMPHVSVEILLPGVFFSFELLLRKNSWSSVVMASIITFVCITGGMPESLFLIVVFGSLYFLFRLILSSDFSERRLQLTAKLAVSLLLGFGMGAFLLLPFAEFARISLDAHQLVNTHGDVSGLAVDNDVRNTVTYLLPTLFGPVLISIFGGGWTGMRAYWGILPTIFAVVAVLALFSKRRVSADQLKPASPLKSLTVFFSISLLLMLLKRFGNPLVNWIGRLPIADMIVFVKYQEPLIAFCVAMLAGIGFSLFLGRRIASGYFFAAVILVLTFILGLATWSLPRVFEHKATAFVFYETLAAGVALLLAVFLMFAVSTRYKRASWLTWTFVGTLALELCFNYIYPNFYYYNSLPSATRDSPYAGAPYLTFLRQQDTANYRVFARDGILYPNWSGAFELMDVRDLDGMFYRRYMNFVRSFLLRSDDQARVNGDLADRFVGSGDDYTYDLTSDLERRFLTLSSVKYVISADESGADNNVTKEIVSQHKTENIWGFGLGDFPVAGDESALGLFQHPPSRRVAFRTVISPAQPMLEGVASIKTEAQAKSAGVGFLLEVESGGKVEPLFSTFLNPKDVAVDRDGRPFRVDLSAFGGQSVDLLFSTDPGPSGNNAWDWAGWAKLRFVPKDGAARDASPFHEVYHHEVRVYEFSEALPRASLFYRAEVVPDADVLNQLKEPKFSPRDSVIVTAETIPEADRAAIGSFTDTTRTGNGQARITSNDSERVQIETQSDVPAMLMLNDANYPGWKVFVNGKPGAIMQVDYLFRGVIVPAGSATVEFDYAPASFRIGSLISIASIFVLIVPFFIRRTRNAVTSA